MSEKTHIEEFTVQEMIKTFKSISNRLQKDFLMMTLILLYIFVVKIIPIPGAGESLDYNESLIKIVALIAFFILYIVISALLFKVYILYRKIDDTLKNYYYDDPAYDYSIRVEGAKLMTSFIISDNFISDFIVSGHRRHPSIGRIVSLNILFTIFSSIISFSIVYDVVTNIFIWYSLLIPTFCVYSLIFYLLTKFFFVKRSVFLKRTEIGRDIIKNYIGVLRFKDSVIPPEINTLLTQLENEFNNLKLLSIFDSKDYVLKIEKNIPLLNSSLDLIPQETASNPDYKTSILRIRERIVDILKDIKKFLKTTDYTLTIDYHSNKVFSTSANNIFSFIYYALKN